ncbi:MAG: protein kinase [Pirellulales bacterium]
MNATGGQTSRREPSVLNTSEHPTDEILRRFALGELDAAGHDEVERHVEACDRCCAVLRTAPDDSLVASLKQESGAAVLQDLPPLGSAAPSSPTITSPIPAELRDHPRYRIIKQVGAGGMGVVYKAEHRFMERLVALKVINRRLLRNANALERFRLEVKAAARLSHPNIVTAHDADQAGDLHILVMEYVDGISVARQVEKAGPMPVKHACQFTRQVALGLQHAHQRGMAHRDIKPQNLMLTKDGRVKILDFGLARLVRERESPLGTDETLDVAAQGGDLTRDGATLGTPDYMAPEQIRSARDADIRSDIYALGGTLYFMLAGHSPFPHGTVADKLLAHLDHHPLDLSLVRPDIPTGLIRVIERMMAKPPDERFASPQQVADALTPFCRSSGAGTSGGTTVVSDAGQMPTFPEWQATPTVALMPPWSQGVTEAIDSGSVSDRVVRFVNEAVVARARLFIGMAVFAVVSALLLIGGLTWNNDRSSAPLVSNVAPAPLHQDSLSASATLDERSRMSRVLIFVPSAGYSAYELELARKATRYFFGDCEVTSTITGAIRSLHSNESSEGVLVRVPIQQARIDDYAALLVLGESPNNVSSSPLSTSGSDAARGTVTDDRSSLRRVVLEWSQHGRPIAAIGAGVNTLAEFDFLQGRSLASTPGGLVNSGFASQDRRQTPRVVVDGPFVTGADAATMKEVVQRMASMVADRPSGTR